MGIADALATTAVSAVASGLLAPVKEVAYGYSADIMDHLVRPDVRNRYYNTKSPAQVQWVKSDPPRVAPEPRKSFYKMLVESEIPTSRVEDMITRGRMNPEDLVDAYNYIRDKELKDRVNSTGSSESSGINIIPST